MFKSPGMYPNALAVMTDAPGGLWIGQQKITAANSKTYNLPVLPDADEAAWLVDWNGKLVKTVMTNCRNCSGMAYGNKCVWMGANADPLGIFQVDMNGKQISHRQIPLGIENGGGCHGVKWHNGKLWIASTRLGGIMRVDPTSWVPEVLIRVSSEERPRLHDVAFDNEGNIWVVNGNNSTSYAEGRMGVNKYDGKTGQLLMTVDLAARIVRPARAGVARGSTHQLRCRHPSGMEGDGEPARRLHLQHRPRVERPNADGHWNESSDGFRNSGARPMLSRGSSAPSQLISHGIPNRSTTIPKRAAQNVFSSGNTIRPSLPSA